MKIALIGATGFIGSALLSELIGRGHTVTALVQHSEKLASHPQVAPQAVDVFNTDLLAAHLAGHDAVVTAFSGHRDADVLSYYVRGIKSIISAAKLAKTSRLLVVGGAGRLEVAPGVQLIDTPDFPPQYKASAEGARTALNLLLEEANLNWTMLSPAALIAPGSRTGSFRLGTDQFMTDAEGQSRISVEDFAVAMINELENAQHIRRRFCVAY